MNFLDPTLLIISIAITAILFMVVAFFTRARWLRIGGVLIASTPLIPLIMLFDYIASRFNWWHYPMVTNTNAPLAWYIAAALGYGAAFGLIGWRIVRRWGTMGLIAFVVGFALFGVARDYMYSITTGIIIFGSGAIPLIADFFSYSIGTLEVQLLMYFIVGPTKSDFLARTKNPVN